MHTSNGGESNCNGYGTSYLVLHPELPVKPALTETDSNKPLYPLESKWHIYYMQKWYGKQCDGRKGI